MINTYLIPVYSLPLAFINIYATIIWIPLAFFLFLIKFIRRDKDISCKITDYIQNRYKEPYTFALTKFDSSAFIIYLLPLIEIAIVRFDCIDKHEK